MERTLVLIKPDAVARGIDNHILNMIIDETNLPNFRIVELKQLTIPEDHAKKHYKEHVGKEHFHRACSLLCEGKLLVLVLEGENIVNHMDKMKKTIRNKYAESISRNCIHVSDSVQSASEEIKLWEPLLDISTHPHIYKKTSQSASEKAKSRERSSDKDPASYMYSSKLYPSNF